MENLKNIFCRKICTSSKKTIISSQERVDLKPLTPTINCDKKNYYCDTLKWAVEEKTVTNIALTGSYGSGKSSILKKFKEQNPYKKCLEISLACFQKGDNDEQKIEFNILKHLTCLHSTDDLPDSKFSRIKNINHCKLVIYAIFVTIWISSLLLVACPDWAIVSSIKSIILSFVDWLKIVVYIVLYLILLSGFGFVAYKVIRSLLSTRISKLSYGKSEIQLAGDEKTSLLNQHLDEIIYVFERQKYDIVIIEDLDRHDAINVFANLREINLLLNKSNRLNGHKVVFIYAIKDDLFKDEQRDRTKFFDFIIPIVPIINVNNSADVLIEKSEKADVKLDNNFLIDVARYIDDMRFLNNIFNEFIIYKNNLPTRLNLEKIFAISVYKNLMPQDFIHLQNHSKEGIVFNLFDKKKLLIKKIIDENNEKISKLEEDLANASQITATSIRDARILFVHQWISNINYFSSFRDSSSNEISLSAILEDTNFQKILDDSITSCYSYRNGQSRLNPFNTIQVNNVGYDKYIELVEAKSQPKETQIENEIKSLKLENVGIENWALKDILNQIQSTEIDELSNKYPVISYFLRNGFIDENYYRYFSYIHEGGRFTVEENDYLSSIKDSDEPNYEFEIRKVARERFAKQILVQEYTKKSSLNLFVLDYLLTQMETDVDFKVRLEKTIKLLSQRKKEILDFVQLYLQKGHSKPLFLKLLCHEWRDIWADILSFNLPKIETDTLMVSFVANCNKNVFKEINEKNLLSKYIAACPNFLELVEKINNEKIQDAIKALSVKFETLLPSKNTSLEEFILGNNLYAINYEMLSFFLSKLNQDDATKSIPNYSNISEIDTMLECVNDDINHYIQNIFLISDEIQENDDDMLMLLNNEDINNENIIKIIENKKFKISDVTKVLNIELHSAIILQSKCVATLENIISYYDEKEQIIDDNLLQFLENNSKVINLKDCSNDNLKISILLENKLSINAYIDLIKNINCEYDNLDVSALNSDKIKILIQLSTLLLNETNLEYLKNKEDMFSFFIEHYNVDKIQSIQQYAINTILNKPFQTITGNCMLKLFEASDFFDNKFALFIFYTSNNELQKDKIRECLQNLGGEYLKLLEAARYRVISDTPENNRLLENLKRLNFIGNYHQASSGISVTFK